MPSRVYVGRLHRRATERDVEKFFKNYGRIADIMLKNGFGFVDFEEFRDADDAVHDLHGRELLGERVIVEHAKGPSGRSSRAPKPTWMDNRYGAPVRTGYKLIVENLSSRVSWQDLKDYMRKAGDVTFADAHKGGRNEGVVEFSSYKDMRRALDKLDGTEISGRKIRLFEDSGNKRESRSRSRSNSERSRSRKGHRRRRSRSDSRSRSASKRRSRRRSNSRSDRNDNHRSRSESNRRRSRSASKKSRSGSRNERTTEKRNRSRSDSNKRSRSKSRSQNVNKRSMSRTEGRSRSRSDSKRRSMSIGKKSRSESKRSIDRTERSRSKSSGRSGAKGKTPERVSASVERSPSSRGGNERTEDDRGGVNNGESSDREQSGLNDEEDGKERSLSREGSQKYSNSGSRNGRSRSKSSGRCSSVASEDGRDKETSPYSKRKRSRSPERIEMRSKRQRNDSSGSRSD